MHCIVYFYLFLLLKDFIKILGLKKSSDSIKLLIKCIFTKYRNREVMRKFLDFYLVWAGKTLLFRTRLSKERERWVLSSFMPKIPSEICLIIPLRRKTKFYPRLDKNFRNLRNIREFGEEVQMYFKATEIPNNESILIFPGMSAEIREVF